MSWKLFGVLLLAAVLSVAAVLPYTFTIQSDTLQALELPFPLPVMVLISMVQSTVLLAICILIGLVLGKKVGLGAPWLEALLAKKPYRDAAWRKSTLSIAVVLGIASAVAIALLDIVFKRLGVDLGPTVADIAVWKGLLASFYGAIGEEIQLRLFLMTVIAWFLSLVVHKKEKHLSAAVAWMAIIIAAILFGLGHLPITAQLTELTPLVVVRAIVLNGIPGIAFGWLFWKRGLVAAMVAHFATDTVLHVLLPLFF